ncbi:hypothetical protein BDV96DRAFT_685626 [Lophiotrema nucula]|uniref:Uncharacterized protein n=1 Tax=Lophiotrema nucula TaxID=690887 RepID=A0A6A5ZHY4_9PLEO|nr:hypothetical protein BDV96DRAFT_685626 [Lophiotrema nucula]
MSGGQRQGVGDIIAKYNRLKGIKPEQLQQIPAEHRRIHDDELRLGRYDTSDSDEEAILPGIDVGPGLHDDLSHNGRIDNARFNTNATITEGSDTSPHSSSQSSHTSTKAYASLLEVQRRDQRHVDQTSGARQHKIAGNSKPPSDPSHSSQNWLGFESRFTSESEPETFCHVPLGQQKDGAEDGPRRASCPTKNSPTMTYNETTPLLHNNNAQSLISNPPPRRFGSPIFQPFSSLWFPGVTRNRFVESAKDSSGILRKMGRSLSGGVKRMRDAYRDPIVRVLANMIGLTCFIGAVVALFVSWN